MSTAGAKQTICRCGSEPHRRLHGVGADLPLLSRERGIARLEEKFGLPCAGVRARRRLHRGQAPHGDCERVLVHA